MGWMQALYDTYEKSKALAGIPDQMDRILLPVGHSTANAQIEVTLTADGSFAEARTVEKGEEVTVIPVTEDSGSRSSGIAPHPLFDKLCYVAGDYVNYCDGKDEAAYEAYIAQLGAWHDAGCHPYVKAVYLYLARKCLIFDLVSAGTLTLDGRGKLDKSVKIEKIAQPDVFVRFRIRTSPRENFGMGELWKEKQVQDDYIKYYLAQIEKTDLDYITGEYMLCTDKQPSKIRYSGDKAKLVSANDTSGFTFRGRFDDKKEALSLGYIPSQEAHNALKWLIERQGCQIDGRTIIVWNPENKKMPDWMADSLEYLEDERNPDLSSSYAKKVKKAVLGKYEELDTQNTDIVVMILDAATPGRLSITYYRQITGSSFLEHLIDWYVSCVWRMSYKRDKKGNPVRMTPAIEDLVRAAYGEERNNFLEVDKKLMKNTLERLMPCIIDGKRIPEDIVRAAVNNASRPLSFSRSNRKKIREITCAMLNRKYSDKNREDEIMALDRNCDNRSYLYGRLLAVAYKMEYDTYTEEEKGKRETNAERYTSQMIQHPARTLLLIRERLQPYRRKLTTGSQVFYDKEMQQIYDLCKPETLSGTERLNEKFLIGYECEIKYLYDSWESWKKEQKSRNSGIVDSAEDLEALEING